MTDEPDILTVAEVARLLRMSANTVYDRAGDGTIPCRRIGRSLRFSRRLIIAWMEGKAA